MFRTGGSGCRRGLIILLILAAEARLFLSLLALAAADLRILGAAGESGGGLRRGLGILRRPELFGLLLRVPGLFREGGRAGLGDFRRAAAGEGGFADFRGLLCRDRPRDFLKSPRVRRLQAHIIGRYLEKYFGITASPQALEVLSGYPDSRLLGGDLAAAAGLRGRTFLSSGDLALCRAVFPGFVALHRLRCGLEARGGLAGPSPGISNQGRGWGRLRKLKKKADRIPLLASREARSARALMEGEILELLYREIRIKRKIRRENLQFALYLAVTGLVSPGNVKSPELEKTLSLIEGNHDKFSRINEEARYGGMEQRRRTDGD